MAPADRVLLVEDDPALRRVVEVSLTVRGYQVDTAASASTALELTEHHPDLIVVDLGLPDMDGVDLVSRLRTSSTVPILVASARDARTAKVAALQAGADDYLPKPFDVEQLLIRIRTLLSSQPPNGDPLRSSA
ncbi:MAG: response regulator transcription factor [Actinomycetota bacterium]|nr:response regulator transcription factor [Actinomycetota bacterium]